MTSHNQPFADIRVIEFGQFVAVPYCGQLLAEGGAEVIKVESLQGDPNRLMGEITPLESRIFISRNRGKHSLPLNLSTPQAKPVMDKLIASADVVLMNFRPGLAQDLGIDGKTLCEKHPTLIVGEITPFGKDGPDAHLSGMDIVVQARSGLMAAMGRVVDGRPAPGEPVISDYMAAMSLAFGVSSALLRRQKTGVGGQVDVSLMQAAMTLANNQLIRHEELDRNIHLHAINTLNELRLSGGSHAEQVESLPGAKVVAIRAVYFRTYDTADGAIAIACASQALQKRFCEALEIDPGSQPILNADDAHIQALKQTVETLLRSENSVHWIEKLNHAGVPVSTVKFPLELFEDPQTQANNMFELVDHPSAGVLRVLSPPVKLDGDGFATQAPTAQFASETQLLLADLGFSAAEIETLVDNGITKVQPSSK